MNERIRRTYAQIFLDGLSELTGGASDLVSNRSFFFSS